MKRSLLKINSKTETKFSLANDEYRSEEETLHQKKIPQSKTMNIKPETKNIECRIMKRRRNFKSKENPQTTNHEPQTINSLSLFPLQRLYHVKHILF